jgi:His/Glu/Gln/Arg/opine family amino acid ABC transporter permease subunit
MGVETAGALQPRTKPDRGVGYFLAEQRPLSSAAALLGASSILVLIVGTVLIISLEGWVPHEAITRAITSPAQGVVLIAAIGLGLAAMVLGWGTYRRMPTKPSREAAVAGAVLGAQGVVFAALFLWFRAGTVEIFARNFFDFQLVAQFWPRFVRGAVNTLILAISGGGLGILLGLVLSVFAISSRRVVRAPARIYINFFRGTPLLWQLSFFYFGFVLGVRLDITVYQAAIIVLALNAGAYSAEIFRAGVQSIERSQLEAARSLGMPYLRSLRYVVLPQAVRRVIPPLTNEFVILIKDTSLVAFLGITFAQQELLSTGRDIYRQFFNATPFLASAAGYLVITLPMIRAVTWLERKLRSGLTGIGA